MNHAKLISAVSQIGPLLHVLIRLDQVITTVERVGRSMPSALCNTGKGGLAVTDTARKLKALLNK